MPATILADEKQRRLCLVAEHLDCSTYVAAAGLTDGGPPAHARARAQARPIARTTPVVLDQRRLALAMPTGLTGRGVGQGGLVALMVVAFGALAAGRLTSGGPDLRPAGDATGSSSPGPSASAVPATNAPDATATPAAPNRTLVPTTVDPTASPSADPTAEPTPVPSASTSPTSYTVARGDTLSGIAAAHGTTWQVLAELNGIDDPGRLRVGQVIELP